MGQVARSGGDVGGCRIDPGRANLWLPQPMWEGGKRREGGCRGGVSRLRASEPIRPSRQDLSCSLGAGTMNSEGRSWV